MKNLKKLTKVSLKTINGGVQGYCKRYCVPKSLHSVECIDNWCVYTAVEP